MCDLLVDARHYKGLIFQLISKIYSLESCNLISWYHLWQWPKNKNIKKANKNAFLEALFIHIRAKMKFKQKLGFRFLDVKIIKFMKKSEKAYQRLQPEMLSWPTEAVRDGQATVISWNPLFMGSNRQRKLDHILPFEYVLDL